MNEKLLNDADVRQLVGLIGKLEESSFDLLRLENNGLKIVISKGDMEKEVSVPYVSEQPEATPVVAVQPTETTKIVTAEPPKPVENPVSEDTIAIKAPIAGLFFAQPEPGAPPYVKVGDRVEKNTTVGLIEVMKVYTSIPAEANGEIVEICAENAQFVEYGQTIFLVKPEAGSEE